MIGMLKQLEVKKILYFQMFKFNKIIIVFDEFCVLIVFSRGVVLRDVYGIFVYLLYIGKEWNVIEGDIILF